MLEVLYWGARCLLFVGTVVLVGGLMFLVLAWPQGTRSLRFSGLLRGGLFAAVAGTVLMFFLHGPYVSGRPLAAALDTALQQDVFDSRFGLLTGVRLIALMTLLWLLHFGLRKPVKDSATVVFTVLYVVMVVATVSFGGHAGTSTTLTMVSHAAHLMAASTWLGGLVVLFRVVLPRASPQHLVAILPTYSTLATISVAVLVVTGTYQAAEQAGSLAVLFSGQWGALLAVKVSIVVIMLGLGFFSRRFTLRYVASVRQALASGEHANERMFRRKLRRNVTREAVAGLLVLAVTAWLVSSNPPSHDSTSTASGDASSASCC